MIEITRLSKQKLRDNCRIMIKGNTHLKALTQMTGMEQVALRARLFKKSFDPLDWPELNAEQAAYFLQAIPDIQAVRDIEWEMMCAFAGLSHQHAKTSFRNSRKKGIVVDVEDYAQEANLALLDAVYTYAKEEIRFITYAWWVIHNRLSTVANKNSPFSPLTNKSVSLLQRFEEAQIKLNRYATESEVYDACGFTENECNDIQLARVKVHNESSLEFNDLHGHQIGEGDYTKIRRGIDNEINEQDTILCNFEIKKIRKAMKTANLTCYERKVVETSLNPYYGWQADLAKTMLNKDNVPLSRMSISNILTKALRKIKSAYMKEAA